MPLQLRSQASSPRAPLEQLDSPPKRHAPRLLPLSYPAQRCHFEQKRHQQHRSALLFVFALALLCIPVTRRATMEKNRAALSAMRSENASVFNDTKTLGEEDLESVPFVPRPRTVLVSATRGGVGNQVYFIAEALFLARHANLDVVIPTLGPRNFGPNSDINTLEESGNDYWDIDTMSRALAPEGKVLTSLPNTCQGRFDAVYITLRNERSQAKAMEASSAAKRTACFLIKDYDWGAEGAPFSHGECEEHIFQDSLVETRILPLSSPPDRYFLDELKSLQESRVLPSGRRDPGRPACVLVDGHAFNVKGREGHEYLHSFLHYIDPAPRFTKMVGNWTLANLAVLHLRHDELECKMNNSLVGRLCIRIALLRHSKESLYWANVTEVANAVVEVMRTEKVKALYIASSPYTPPQSLSLLRDAIGDRVHIAQKVNSRLSHNDQNFVERELAIRAKCFIGEFSSTWSGTVYYKRRTLGKKTFWTNVLLGKDGEGLGHYKPEEALGLPDTFEARGIGFET